MQGEDGKILFLPAWPKECRVDFRPHARGKTIVASGAENGEILDLKVTPEPHRDLVEIIQLRGSARLEADELFLSD